nr:MAG TPA: Putative head tail adaptor [Caudoviricetes sp.]
MKIGQWRQRIVIQQNRMVSDKDGNQRNEWADYYSCWAYANHLSGKEYWEAARGGLGAGGGGLCHDDFQRCGNCGVHHLYECHAE